MYKINYYYNVYCRRISNNINLSKYLSYLNNWYLRWWIYVAIKLFKEANLKIVSKIYVNFHKLSVKKKFYNEIL